MFHTQAEESTSVHNVINGYLNKQQIGVCGCCSLLFALYCSERTGPSPPPLRASRLRLLLFT